MSSTDLAFAKPEREWRAIVSKEVCVEDLNLNSEAEKKRNIKKCVFSYARPVN